MRHSRRINRDRPATAENVNTVRIFNVFISIFLFAAGLYPPPRRRSKCDGSSSHLWPASPMIACCPDSRLTAGCVDECPVNRSTLRPAGKSAAKQALMVQHAQSGSATSLPELNCYLLASY